MPAGSSLEETDRVLQHIESFIRQAPETESYSRRTGTELGFAVTEPNTGDFLVKLKANRDRSVEEIQDELRGKILTAEPSIDIEFVGIVADLIGDLASSPEPVEIRSTIRVMNRFVRPQSGSRIGCPKSAASWT